MQSAHTDIGYTHPQEQIARMYLDHYDRVLDLCRLTADQPETTRFKWTCETFWQVQNYLTQRPQRLDEFLHYVRAGQIEITASYLHFTDLIDTDAYRRSIELAVAFCRQHELPLRCAMHCDINGWPWGVADILAGYDIPYFCSQIHIDNATDPLGQRGSVHYHWIVENPAIRPDAPIRVPQAFWWVGPQNGRVLHWLNEHYLLGNVLGVSSPQPFGADKTPYFYETDHLTSGDLYQIAQREVPRYIERLRAAGYSHEIMLLSTGGYYVDNARPDHRWLEVIARWNADHEDICLRTATLGEWFDTLNSLGVDHLPTRQVAWPDHWAHGLGSSTSHIAQARRTQRRREAAAALVQHTGSSPAAQYLDLALQQERLALEHTFDAWSTSFRPEAAANHFQQIAKELTFHRAELYLDEAVGMALRALPSANGASESRLYVPAALHGETLQLVHFDAGDNVIDPQTHALIDQNQQTYPLQYDNDRLRQFVSVVPARSAAFTAFALTQREQPAPNRPAEASPQLNTQHWSLQIDPATGGLTSLRDMASGREWAGAHPAYRFGQLVHEAVVHPLKREAAGNHARWIGLGIATDEMRRTFSDGQIFEHTTLAISANTRHLPGEVFDAVVLEGSADRIGQVQITWRCYHRLPIVELVLDWHKQWNDLPEAAYVAFPFAATNARLELETGGGFFVPGSHDAHGQLAGTSSGYYTIQRAARISDQTDQLLWLPLDAPLVMPNEINYNRWETDPWVWNGFLASMPVNHYWHTNFPTSQRGYMRLRYRWINPAGFADHEAALRTALPVDAFGWRS